MLVESDSRQAAVTYVTFLVGLIQHQFSLSCLSFILSCTACHYLFASRFHDHPLPSQAAFFSTGEGSKGSKISCTALC